LGGRAVHLVPFETPGQKVSATTTSRESEVEAGMFPAFGERSEFFGFETDYADDPIL